MAAGGGAPSGLHFDANDVDLYNRHIISGIARLYKEKLKPLEQEYRFDQFHSQFLTDVDFHSKPMVLMLGQYSTGKTSFIQYLLGRDFPGQHIGPEPTTDRFMAIMYGQDERRTPGNAAALEATKPFTGLSQFGTAFLSKFETSQFPSHVTENITLIDTPGILSGEKQRLERGYDFTRVCEWYAEKSDLILLLFDAHKLDISDEFKAAIHTLRPHSDKIRVVLNKADMVNTQQLMRVYGALMWSLGKVVQSPEAMRVYMGSFWDQPLHFTENEKLFAAEREDLMNDLRALPRNSAIRKVNELVKRARMARVHGLIISALKKNMPSMFGKEKKQTDLINRLEVVYEVVAKQNNIAPGDFPNPERMREKLRGMDFSKFHSLKPKLFETMDEMLSVDLPRLMQSVPRQPDRSASIFGPPATAPSYSESSEIDLSQTTQASGGGYPPQQQPHAAYPPQSQQHPLPGVPPMHQPNPTHPPPPFQQPQQQHQPHQQHQQHQQHPPPLSVGQHQQQPQPSSPNPFFAQQQQQPEWLITAKEKEASDVLFDSLSPIDGKVSEQAQQIMIRSGLPNEVLGQIWTLADIDRDGALDRDEFALAMWLTQAHTHSSEPVPPSLPPLLVPPSKR